MLNRAKFAPYVPLPSHTSRDLVVPKPRGVDHQDREQCDEELRHERATMDQIAEEYYVFDLKLKRGARTMDKKNVLLGLSTSSSTKPTNSELDPTTWIYTWAELENGGAGDIDTLSMR
mgnify:CR=1 FL=1